MIKTRRKILMVAFKIIDMLIIAIGFLSSSILVSGPTGINVTSFDTFLQQSISIKNFLMLISIVFICHIIFYMFRLYQSKRFSKLRTEIIDILTANVFFIFAFYSITASLNSRFANPIFTLCLYFHVVIIMIIARIVMRGFLKIVRKRGRNLRNLLLIGTNERAVLLASKLLSTPELGYRITGFVDDQWKGMGNFEKTGFEIVADFEGLGNYIKTNIVDEVFISLPVKSKYQEIASIINICEKNGVIIRSIPNIFDTKSSKFKMEYLNDDSFTIHYTGAMDGWQLLVKWLIDWVLAFIFLFLMSPIFILVALLIKITSPGSIFFIQERIGLNKRRFPIYKFRTMYENAEEMQLELEDLNEVEGAAFKIEDDPRITKIGKYLRKFSIDELPQFINILKGDMSLVGPRPLPVRDYNGFRTDWHRRRFSVKPGITCLWQINGRHNISFEKWMKMDMEYIDKWSLLMDAKIIFKTIPVVLKGDGAS